MSVRVKRPRLTAIPGVKAPPGWNLTDISLKERGIPQTRRSDRVEPAGDPPKDWPGTRPEWAVYWALLQEGMKEGLDFISQATTPGVEKSYYSTLDFLLPYLYIGIEVQGVYWHQKQGSDVIANDEMRRALFAGQGITLIFIDEPDALRDPKFFVSEALKGRDHSALSTGA